MATEARCDEELAAGGLCSRVFPVDLTPAVIADVRKRLLRLEPKEAPKDKNPNEVPKTLPHPTFPLLAANPSRYQVVKWGQTLRARSQWAEKASPSPQIRRGRIRVPSPAPPRLSLSVIFAFGRTSPGEPFSRSGENLDTAKGSQEKYPWRS